jgi:hypothetical protein
VAVGGCEYECVLALAVRCVDVNAADDEVLALGHDGSIVQLLRAWVACAEVEKGEGVTGVYDRGGGDTVEASGAVASEVAPVGLDSQRH